MGRGMEKRKRKIQWFLLKREWERVTSGIGKKERKKERRRERKKEELVEEERRREKDSEVNIKRGGVEEKEV